VTLFRQVTLRHLFGEPGRTLVALLGVALGIAVFLSIRLANGSVLAAFSATVDAVSGKAQLQATGGPKGLPDAAYGAARATEGVLAVAPIVQAAAAAPDWGRQPITVLGVDLFSEPAFRSYQLDAGPDRAGAMRLLGDSRALAVSGKLAAERSLRVGDPVRLEFGAKTETWRVAAILRSDELGRAYAGRIAVADIAAAQEAFGKVGRLDRLDVMLAPGASAEAVRSRLMRALGPSAMVERPRTRAGQVESLLGAFQLNLTALSAIAVFVGMFLIYNSMSISVVRRRREIGMLRALGVSRRGAMGLFLAEGAFYGLAGSALGVAAGVGMARLALKSVAATVTALYVRVEADRLTLDPALIGQAVLIGILTAVAASLAPAWEAAATPPGQSAREGSVVGKASAVAFALAVGGLALLALAAAMSWGATRFRLPYLGFSAAFAVLGGFSMVTPILTAWFARGIRPVWDRLFGVEGLLAAGYLSDALDRTAVVVAALMVSLSMFVGVSVMVGSFRRTVQAWVDQTIRADIFVQPAASDASGSDALMPPSALRAFRAVPGIDGVDEYRAAPGASEGRPIVLSAATFDVLARRGSLLFREGHSAEIVRRAKARNQIIVTEGLTLRFNKREGDTLNLSTPRGPRAFRIAGVFYDYTTSGPTVVMDRALYRRIWDDDGVNSVALYLRPGADANAAMAWLARNAPNAQGLSIVANRDLHDRVLRIFDQTFRVTYALELISIVVAVLGIINTMTALILQRGRELGILRAVGATQRQLKRVILLESGLIGLAGYAIGVACGSALALLLIYVINKQFFGWTVQARWTPGVFVQGAAITVVTAVLAGLAPARQAARRGITEAIRAE
jgi:putative ABC transport system permease protein